MCYCSTEMPALVKLRKIRWCTLENSDMVLLSPVSKGERRNGILNRGVYRGIEAN